MSKATVGQTMSADDGASLAQAKVHNEVRLDLLEADAKAESNTLNRMFVRQPFCDLNFAPGRRYPRLIIDVPKPENLELLIKAVTALVPLGLKIEQSVIRDKFGLPEPSEGAEVLAAAAAPMDDMVDAVKELLESVSSLEELRDRLIELTRTWALTSSPAR